ncbi:MAG: hypothetical protein JXP72_10405 [Coriobacteriia bacterium]|nr:hypothetical protein [Coriobacteriia bacterium]
MKRFLLVSLALLLVFSLTACGGGGGTTEGGSTAAPGDTGGSTSSGSSSGGTSDGIATVEDLKAFLAEGHADAEWYPDITDITTETMLGAPVLAIHVAWTSVPDDFDAMNRKTMAISDLISNTEQSIAPNVALLLADGTVTDLFASGGAGIATMDQAFDLPPAPTTAEEVSQWLEAVYGPGGLVTLGADETWYSAIQSIGMETIADDDTLVVTTSAPTFQSLDASLLGKALLSTGSPLLESYSIRTADGSGSGGFAQTLVGSGFFYPVE